MKQRDARIDFLRFLGLSLIILAHVQAPYSLTQIRCFDVPLMLFVSGLATSGKQIDNYWSYIIKRTKRLLVPVWLFLAVYLSVFYCAQFILLPEQYLTGKMICRSFLLLDDSIGYVWIIRVFLIVMLLTPSLLRICRKCGKVYSFFLLILLMGIVLYVLNLINTLYIQDSILLFFSRDYLQYGIAYSIPFVLGVQLKRYRGFNELFLLLFLFVVFCIIYFFLYSDSYIFPKGLSSEFKSPPQVYYICYGCLISVFLWCIRPLWEFLTKMRSTSFIGQNTIWIYLWHMPLALFATVYFNNWIIKYIFVYCTALVLFLIQYYLIVRFLPEQYRKYLKG